MEHLMDRWSLFVNRWKSCTACDACKTRQNVVLARGSIPCDLLLVGEGPGHSEDACGVPFVPGAPAGELLDRIIARSVPQHLKYCLTNLVCCIPLDDDGTKTAQPTDESIQACSVRLVEFVELASPKLLVCVGELAESFTDSGYKKSIKFHKKIPRCCIVHPAGILRMPSARQSMAAQRCVVQISTAIEEVFDNASHRK
jgi:uracil-DNA glycosylase